MKKKEITHVLLIGASGKLGKHVYYSRNGKTFERKAPGSYNRTPSEKQAPYRDLFREAIRFAKVIINEPVLKAFYKKRTKRYIAYSKAVSDYLKGEVPAFIREKIQHEFVIYDRIAAQKSAVDNQQSNNVNDLNKTLILTAPAFNKWFKARPLPGSSSYGTVVSQYLSGWMYS